MANKQVFITGVGAVTACGGTAYETWQAILAKQHGLAEISQWDIASWPARLGGEIKDFQPAKMLPDRKLLKVISPQDALGINAAVQAVADSGIITYRDSLASAEEFNERTAIFAGSPGNKYFQQYDFLPLLAKTNSDMQQFAEQLFNEVNPMWLLKILPNNVLAYTGIHFGFKGLNHNITNHAVSGTQAILEAYHAIQQGQADQAIVVAYDQGIEPQALFYYERLGVLSNNHLKPFDKQHDGTILADGAAAMVLESAASAARRSARCYAEIVGGMSATEASGLFTLKHSGEPLAKLIDSTLTNVGCTTSDIDFVVAHGNGNCISDDSEAYAIADVFHREHDIPVTAFKWSMGHTLSASGMIDAVLTSYALYHQCLPGITNFSEPASSSLTLNISNQHQQLPKKQNTALMINRGFASMNACLVIKSCG